jgi:hypothetical protein
LKKPKESYLRFDVIPKNKELIYDLCVLLQKENTIRICKTTVRFFEKVAIASGSLEDVYVRLKFLESQMMRTSTTADC